MKQLFIQFALIQLAFSSHTPPSKDNVCKVHIGRLHKNLKSLESRCGFEVKELIKGIKDDSKLFEELKSKSSEKELEYCTQDLSESVQQIKSVLTLMETGDYVTAVQDIIEFSPIIEGVEEQCPKTGTNMPPPNKRTTKEQPCSDSEIRSTLDFPKIKKEILKGIKSQPKAITDLTEMIRDAQVGMYDCVVPFTTTHTGKKYSDPSKLVNIEKCFIPLKAMIPTFEKLIKLMKTKDTKKVKELLTESTETVRDVKKSCLGPSTTEEPRKHSTKFNTEDEKETMTKGSTDMKIEKFEDCLEGLSIFHRKATKFVENCI